jgi:hypothetical protein
MRTVSSCLHYVELAAKFLPKDSPEVVVDPPPLPTEAERQAELSKDLGLSLLRDSEGGNALARLARQEDVLTHRVTRCFQLLHIVRIMTSETAKEPTLLSSSRSKSKKVEVDPKISSVSGLAPQG